MRDDVDVDNDDGDGDDGERPDDILLAEVARRRFPSRHGGNKSGNYSGTSPEQNVELYRVERRNKGRKFPACTIVSHVLFRIACAWGAVVVERI